MEDPEDFGGGGDDKIYKHGFSIGLISKFRMFIINRLDFAQICLVYFRSGAWQKICNEVAVNGPPVGGGILRCGSVAFNRRCQGAKPPAAGGLGAEPPALENFVFFWQK